MYIGKITVSSTWNKVEDLIKEQVSGQSSFAFEADKIYQLQCEGGYGVRLCNTGSTPAQASDGEYLSGAQTAQYRPQSGAYLYVRPLQDLPPAAVQVIISQIG